MAATITAFRPRSRKPAYKPMVRIVDRPRGLYTVTSERYGGHVLYLVDAVNGRCECEGSAQWGKVCKHLKAARLCHAAFSPQPLPAPVAAPAARPDLVERYGKAADLLDAFGA